LLINFLNIYLDRSGFKSSKLEDNYWNYLALVILYLKVGLFVFLLHVNSSFNIDDDLIWCRFFVEMVIFTVFFIYAIFYFIGVVPPTIDKAFIDNFKILLFVFIYEVFNVVISVNSIIKLNINSSIRDLAIFSVNLMTSSGINLILLD
jgi:hypothetical protein